jgi:starvation-inducible DNA-binding protein
MSSTEVLHSKVHAEPLHNGIDATNARRLADGLSHALAETYVLYLKTQGFHWNVVGPLFFALHKLTEEQYQDLGEAVDKLAERIRALGFPAPASFEHFLELSAVQEAERESSARDMINILIQDHETVCRTFRELTQVADQAGDVATADVLTKRVFVHEKAAWMLRSTVAQ